MPSYYCWSGATGANDGSSQADAWVDLASFLSVAAAGDICYLRGTQTPASTRLEATTSGTINNRIKLIGVDDSWNNNGTLATLDATNPGVTDALYGSGLYWDLENIHCTNGSNTALNIGNVYWNLKNCKFSNSTSGIYTGRYFASNCYFVNCTNGAYQPLYSTIVNSLFINCSSIAAYLGAGSKLINCILHEGANGVYTGATVSHVGNCIIDGFTNAYYASAFGPGCLNSRITNSTNGLNGTAGAQPAGYSNNYFYNPSGTDVNSSSGWQDFGNNRLTGVNSSDGYADLDNHDFTLVKGADGVDVEIDIGNLVDAVNKGYITQGIEPAPASGGGGSNASLRGGFLI